MRKARTLGSQRHGCMQSMIALHTSLAHRLIYAYRCYLYVLDLTHVCASLVPNIDKILLASQSVQQDAALEGIRSILFPKDGYVQTKPSGNPPYVRTVPYTTLIIIERVFSELAKTMKELEVDHDMIQTDPSKLAVLFKEMIQMCLW